VHETGEIELELVAVPRCIRALNLTELTLEAGTHYPFRVVGSETANIAVVSGVEEIEENRKAITVLEAHATPVTDLEGACDLHLQRSRFPIPLVFRVVAQALGGEIRHSFIIFGHNGSRIVLN
jgi:hypothetical protein